MDGESKIILMKTEPQPFAGVGVAWGNCGESVISCRIVRFGLRERSEQIVPRTGELRDRPVANDPAIAPTQNGGGVLFGCLIKM